MKVIDLNVLPVGGGAQGFWVVMAPRVRGVLCRLQ